MTAGASAGTLSTCLTEALVQAKESAMPDATHPTDRDARLEQWRSIEGAPGYEVSDLGRVRSLERMIMRSNGRPHTAPATMLTPRPSRKGYLRVVVNPGHRDAQIHRLVALAFIPCHSDPDTLQVNHINGIKTDNRAVNLEWCTNLENMQHRMRLLKGTHG